MIVAMLKQKGARGKTKPAVHFATDLAREGLCARIKLAASVCGLSVAQTLRPLSNSCLPEAHRQYRSAAVTASVTEVELVFYEGRIEHWLRFGTQDRERILDRRRRVVAFAPGEIFAFVRWEGNDYGTVLSRLDILRACDAGERINTLPGVTPGGEILLRLDGWPRVKRALDAIADIEARGIDPAAVAPDWWRHLHNRIICNMSHRAYTRSQHAAWQRRRRLVG